MSRNDFKSINRPKIGLALSGGVALGWAHIGVLEALEESAIPIDYISGTSSGALVAALYAFGIPISEMAKKSGDLKWYRIFSFSRSRLGLAKHKALGRLLRGMVGEKRIEDAKIPLAIMTCDIKSGNKVVIKDGDLASAVTASSAIPGVFTPERVAGRLLVDGAVSEYLPLSPLFDFGADVVLGVDLSRYRTRNEPKHAIDVIMSTYDILIDCQTKVSRSRADVLIEPRLEGFSASDFHRAEELIGIGRKSAMDKIPEILLAIKNARKKRTPSPLNFLSKLFGG